MLPGIRRPRSVARRWLAVVLVPGLFASDLSLHDLRTWVDRIGYRPYLSRIGRNMGCPDAFTIGRLLGTINEAAADTGTKVRLVGHSLGGILARDAARQRPDLASQASHWARR